MNTKLIIITVAVIVVLGGGFLAYKYLPENTVNIFDDGKEQANISLPDGSDNNATDNNNPDGPAITQITDNYLDVPFLENISSEEMMLLQRSDNYLSLSNLNNICQRKSTTEERDACLETLKIRQVSILDNAEYCNQLSGSKKDTCFNNMAFKNNDLSLCASIESQTEKSNCQDQLTRFKAQKDKNVLLCLDLSNDLKDQCISGVFSNETDLAYCDTDVVKNNSLVDICQSMIYRTQAFERKDISTCEQIPLENYKDSCFAELSI